MKRLVAFLTLFTSLGTLICCALPALFVVLGFGAAFAGIVGNVPQLVWISEHKSWVFGIGAVFLSVGGVLQWKTRRLACPTDARMGEANDVPPKPDQAFGLLVHAAPPRPVSE